MCHNCEFVMEYDEYSVRGVLTPGEIDDLPSLINVFTTLGTSSTIVPDIWIGFISGAARFAGYLGVRGIDYTLNLILKIAVNDANDDWITLCEDCSPTPVPFVSPTATIPGSYTGEPYTFIENTVTGGSVWDLTFQNINGTIAIAVNFLIPTGPTCVRITAVTGTVVNYQHNLCAGGQVTGAGSGASSTVEYSQLGWFGSNGGDVIRVTAEPV